MTHSLPCTDAASMESTSSPVGVRPAETSRVAAGTPAAVRACLTCSVPGFGAAAATAPSVSVMVFCSWAVAVPGPAPAAATDPGDAEADPAEPDAAEPGPGVLTAGDWGPAAEVHAASDESSSPATAILAGILVRDCSNAVVDWGALGLVTVPFCHAAPRGNGAA